MICLHDDMGLRQCAQNDIPSSNELVIGIPRLMIILVTYHTDHNITSLIVDNELLHSGYKKPQTCAQ